jgi:putative transposase
MLKRCEEIMREVCGSFETELKEFNGEADHVHLLVHYPPKVALSGLVNSLKDVSSRRLRAQYTGRVNRVIMHDRFRSPSCFAGSCGGAPPQVVKDYIAQQKQPD